MKTHQFKSTRGRESKRHSQATGPVHHVKTKSNAMDNSADGLLMSADSHIQMSKNASYQVRGGLNTSLPDSKGGKADIHSKFGTIAPPEPVNQSFQQNGAGKL